MNLSRSFRAFLIAVFMGSATLGLATAQDNVSARGTLLKNGSQLILYLSGGPYEIGIQHGAHLKEAIARNVKRFIDDQILANKHEPRIKAFLDKIPVILEFVPEDYKAEMMGVAKGSEQPYEKILLLNLFPEMFHCLGLTVAGKATSHQELYHVRSLDYSAGTNLQDSAVLMILEPKGKIPFFNVTYAGFIGSITGINMQHIAVGEIGGKGYGKYEGMPMAFLLRTILEKTGSLNQVKEILSNTHRTCEYYYVFSDGKNKESFGVYATSAQLDFIHPGESYAIFDCGASNTDHDDKLLLQGVQVVSSKYQTVLYTDKKMQQQLGLINKQLEDCVILTGFPYPERYPVLVNRLVEHYGKIGVTELQEALKTPVVRPSNLHNAIFAPQSLELWLSHAGPNGELASEQPYIHYQLKELMNSVQNPVNLDPNAA